MTERLTSLRKSILSHINKSKTPVSVKMISLFLETDHDLSTIYRALDYLESENLIQSLSWGRMKFYFGQHKQGCGHFLLCKNCQEIHMFTECALKPVIPRMEKKYKYTITNHLIFLEGYCKNCMQVAKKLSV